MQTSMPVTLTIKQVPKPVALRLKNRAQANRRSLQKELLSIIETAANEQADAGCSGIAESESARYCVNAVRPRRHASRVDVREKLTLDQLWQRAQRLGSPVAAESTAIVRCDRDGRHGR